MSGQHGRRKSYVVGKGRPRYDPTARQRELNVEPGEDFMRIENPEIYPAYVYIESPTDYNAPELRGGPWFDLLATMGFRVQRIAVIDGLESAQVQIHRPRTFIYWPVQFHDISAEMAALRSLPVCVIMDLHFPAHDMTTMVTKTDESWLTVHESREVILNNLTLACAVSVPRGDWAAGLAEARPALAGKIWHLPDIERPSMVQQFGVKFSTIVTHLAQSAHQQPEAHR